jgi:hypothetical protein
MKIVYRGAYLERSQAVLAALRRLDPVRDRRLYDELEGIRNRYGFFDENYFLSNLRRSQESLHTLKDAYGFGMTFRSDSWPSLMDELDSVAEDSMLDFYRKMEFQNANFMAAHLLMLGLIPFDEIIKEDGRLYSGFFRVLMSTHRNLSLVISDHGKTVVQYGNRSVSVTTSMGKCYLYVDKVAVYALKHKSGTFIALPNIRHRGTDLVDVGTELLRTMKENAGGLIFPRIKMS